MTNTHPMVEQTVATHCMYRSEIAELRMALYMCAAHFHGGHSAVGAAAAKALGITFPVTMKKLATRAHKEGLNPKKLWPWWDKAPTLTPHKCGGTTP